MTRIKGMDRLNATLNRIRKTAPEVAAATKARVATKLADQIRQDIPVQTGSMRRHVRAEGGTVINDDPGAASLEFGNANQSPNPVHRRAVKRVEIAGEIAQAGRKLLNG